MTLTSGLDASGGLPALRALYDSEFAGFLAAQDARLTATRRQRWCVLIIGLGIAAGIMTLVQRSGTSNELGPMAAFAISVVAIGYFWFATAQLGDDIRHDLMRRIAEWLHLQYDAKGEGFDLDRFALLGLARSDKITRADRLCGAVNGLDVDLMAAGLGDEQHEGIGSERRTRTVERFSGLLVRITDPAPPRISFRLVPPQDGMLHDITIITHTTSASTRPPSFQEMRAMLAQRPESAAATATGDTAFDARFALHASEPEVQAAQHRLDPGTRAALLDIAASFGGGPVSIGFDGQDILFAFVTRQRFEIGPLRPPMADFSRVQHLAEQMGILVAMADRLRQARLVA